MAELNKEFGELLTQGLKSIAAHEHKSLLVLEELLGCEMKISRWSVEKWRQGVVPAAKHIDYLARACVRRANMDKQWLNRFLTQSRFPTKGALVQELFPEKTQLSLSVPRNIPGRPYEQFVGRDEELAKLEQFLSPRHRIGVICLHGIGGVGKTALALEVAHRKYEHRMDLPPDERFDAIVWVTAKQAELLPAGITARNPTFTDLNDLYRAIAEVLDQPAITRTVKLADREVIVIRILSERRVLLILDNLEDIDDPALTVFLRDLPAPSKAIVTTRHRISVAVTIQVTPLNKAEALKLIEVECRRQNLVLTTEQIEKLLKRLGHLPLAIVRTIGRMIWRGSTVQAELRYLSDPKHDMYDFCFRNSIALIQGHDAHKLFMVLALFHKDATRDALGYVAGFEDIHLRDEGLCDLEVLSLVNKEGMYYSLEPLTKAKAQFELSSNPQFELEVRERWSEWYKWIVSQIESTRQYFDYRGEISNVKNVIDWLIVQKRMDDASWFYRRILRFFFAIGRWGVLVRWAEHILPWAEAQDDTGLLADMLKILTNIFLWQADFARGKDLLERIQSTAKRLNNEILLAEALLNKVKIQSHQILCTQKDFEIVTEVLLVFRRHDKTELIVDALKTLGNLHLQHQHVDASVQLYKEGLELLGTPIENEGFAVQHLRVALRGNLAHAAGRQGHFAKACEILKEALKEFTDPTDFAEAYASLASYEYRLGYSQQAHLHRQQADRIIKQFNMSRPICTEDADWEQLTS